MARKADIQYVHHYYTSGTAAKKVAVKAQPKKKPIPHFEPRFILPDREVVVKVDPISIGAIVVCAVLMVMMVVSLFQYSGAYQRNVELQKYIYALEEENLYLERDYKANIDLDQIEAQAMALGMIPVSEAQTIQISGRAPAHEAEPTRWERLGLFLRDLFA